MGAFPLSCQDDDIATKCPNMSKLVNLKLIFISREKLSDNMKAGSFPKDKVFYCDPGKLLPLARFLPQPKKPAGKVAKPAGRGYVFL